LAVDASGDLLFSSATPIIQVPDNNANAFRLVDAGALEYLRIASTNAFPGVVWNEGGADIDFRWESSGVNPSLYIQGSDGYVGIGTGAPGAKLDVRDGNINLSDADVAHGMTGVLPTDAFAQMIPIDAAKGGLGIYGASDDAGIGGIQIIGIIGVVDPTDTTSAVRFIGGKKNALTWQALGALETVFSIANYGTTILTALGNGSIGIGGVPTFKFEVISAANDAFARLISAGANSTPMLQLTNDARTWTIMNDGLLADIFKIRDSSAGADRLVIDAAGLVGIGRIPTAQLDVVRAGAGDIIVAETNTSNQNNIVCRVTANAITNASISFYLENDTPASVLYAQIAADNLVRVTGAETGYIKFITMVAGAWAIRASVGVGLTVNSLGGAGPRDVGADNNGLLYVPFVSDEAFKTKIEPITGALEAVCGLRGVTFNWNEREVEKIGLDFSGSGRQIGLIAQEVEPYIPLAVCEPKEYKSVDVKKITPYLIEAIKELTGRLEKLEAI